MYISSNNNKIKNEEQQKDGRKEEIKKLRKRKIKEMEQNEQVICTMSK